MKDLDEPIVFWLPRQEDLSDLGVDESSFPFVVDRGCAFWEAAAAAWSSAGCVVDDEGTNFTHVHCHCNHLTTFAASGKKALCRFCKVNIAKFQLHQPEVWFKFRWGEPGIWILLCLLAAMYQ